MPGNKPPALAVMTDHASSWGKVFKNLQRVIPRLYAAVPYHLGPGYAFPPLHAYFEVTYRCNLRCEMCHFLRIIEETGKGQNFKKELNAAAIKKAVDSLSRFSVITFTGGEAFLKPDFFEILEYAAARNKTHIITNGTTLTPAVVDKLLDLRLRSLFGGGLFFVGVSLEGGEKLHDRVTGVPGSFAKTTKGLERLVQRRRDLGARYPMLHLTCVIGKSNAGELADVYDYTNELGVEVCNFVLKNPAEYWHAKGYDQKSHLYQPTPPVEEIAPEVLADQLDRLAAKSREGKTELRFSPNGITRGEILRYYANRSSYKNYQCYAAWAKVGVSAYGDVFSCPHYRSATLTGGGEVPWNVAGYREFRQLLKKEKIFPGCLGCCQSEYTGS